MTTSILSLSLRESPSLLLLSLRERLGEGAWIMLTLPSASVPLHSLLPSALTLRLEENVRPSPSPRSTR
jgi:hypothetical protein